MISPNWYPNTRQLRQFAVICLFGFGLIGLMVLRVGGSFRAATVLWIVGAVIMLVGLARPEAVRIVYVVLTAITLPIGWAVSAVLLRTLFYLVVTPLGLVFRLVGRDALRLRRPRTDSYWLEHVERTEAVSYFRQS